jgi:hypothetical protein
VQCYLVLVETSGIQRYIFDTNKRRENVGASYLAASVGRWTTRALTDMAREAAIDPGWTPNSRIAAMAPVGRTAEIVVRAAGPATVVVTDESAARGLIARVTLARPAPSATPSRWPPSRTGHFRGPNAISLRVTWPTRCAVASRRSWVCSRT